MRYGLLAMHLIIFTSVGVFVVKASSAGVRPKSTQSLAALTKEAQPADALDQLSSADIAVHIARVARLDESTAVTNQADSVAAQLTITPADDQVVAKTQVVATSLKSKKDIKTYVTVAGDSVESVAAKFGVTSDTIRWSNDLRGSSLPVGRELIISPVNGIVYTVGAGDTVENIAARYRADAALVRAFNDAELEGSLKPGEKIVIPDGTLPGSRGGGVPVVPASFQAVFGGYNGYDFGWCTWWAATRRAQMGRPVPSNLGNACTWAGRARVAGIPTGAIPKQGAVIMTKGRCWGHVGVVERMNEDGSIWVSDMNSRGQRSPEDPTPAGGWNRVSWRRVTPDQFGGFEFIY